MTLLGYILINLKKISYRNFYTNFHRNLLALVTSTASQIIIQIISLPLFLAYLTIEKYAIWLLAYNVAQLTGLLDFGSIAYSQNKLSYLNAQRKVTEIDSHLKQIINILVLNFTLFLLMIFLLQFSGNEKFSAPLITVFVCSNLLQSLWGLLEALTRFDSKITIGLYTSNALRLGEFFGTTVGLFIFSNNLINVALVSLMFKTIIFLLMLRQLYPKYRFLKVGLINWNQIIAIGMGGIPFFLTKIADFITLSGLLIVLHGKISTNEFVLFVASRTFFRLGLQVTSLVAHSYSYEMTSSWVSRDLNKMKSLIKNSNRINIILTTIGIFIYTLVGQNLFAYWVNKKIEMNSLIILWGACYSFILSINQNQKTKFYAVNHSFLVSVIQIAYSILLVFIVAITKFDFSVVDLFILLSFFELACFITVAFTSRNSIYRHFHDSDSINSIEYPNRRDR